MKRSLFPQLAWTGIRKNRKLYLPYLLTCIGMVMMQYIVGHLSGSGVLCGLRGGRMLCEMLELGTGVIALFALLFLNYSSSFLMRRRKKEFGLYNILGMGKKHLAVVLLWEMLFTAGLSLSLGLLAGTALSKAAEMCIVRFMKGSANYTLSLSVDSLLTTLVIYAAIFALILLRSLWQIRRSSALSLLASESAGERLPRLTWLWGTLGAGLLAYAYYLAVSVKQPMSALWSFFLAVLLVIVATYLLFVSGSVLLCQLLKRNKKYYYRADHFVSVSSMAYRMTRNGAGLASICILLTMVLVMLSSTSCLYFGMEDSLKVAYPRLLTMEARLTSRDEVGEERFQAMKEQAEETVLRHGATQQNVLEYRAATVYGQMLGTELETDSHRVEIRSSDVYAGVWTVHFIPLEDYNRLSGEQRTLAPGEALLYAFRADYPQDTLSVRGTDYAFRICGRLDEFPADADTLTSVSSVMYLVIPDFEETLKGLGAQIDSRALTGEERQESSLLSVRWIYYYDVDAGEEAQKAIYEEMAFRVWEDAPGMLLFGCRAAERDSFLGTFAGLFMLGIILSVVFLFAAVLMIYYKQITEGYEDQSRFEIMQKVGMTRRDIRRSINSQMLTVFMLPLLTAGLHMAFAFPLIRLLLTMFNMTNTALFVYTTLISFAVFGLMYVIVYRITSNAYYAIVAGRPDRRLAERA